MKTAIMPIPDVYKRQVQTSIRKPELIVNSTVGVAGTVTVKKTQAVLYGNTPEVSKAVSTTAVPQEDDFFVEAVPPEDIAPVLCQ